MNKVTGWVVGIAAVLFALFLFGGGMMMGGWGNRGYGMMSGYGMMGNWGHPLLGWFGMGLGMLFMWIVPLGVIGLIVYGAVVLTRNTENRAPSTPLAPCPHCGKGTQADWKNCPYCGSVLK